MAEAISQDVARFLTQLSVALHKYRAYPEGHPMREEARAATLRNLTPLLNDRPDFRVSIGRRQLLVGEGATDEGQPVLRELAERLNRRQIGAIVFRRGVEPAEFDTLVGRLNVDPRSAAPEDEDQDSWRFSPHIELYSMTYRPLALAEAGERDTAGATAEELWAELARLTALGREETRAGSLDLRQLAEAIAAQSGDPALVQALREALQRTGGAAAAAGGAQAARFRDLLSALPPKTLAAILDIHLNTPSGVQRLLSASEWVSVPTLISLIQASTDTGGKGVSHFVLRLLRKLAAGFRADGAGEGPADEAVHGAMRSLLEGWHLEDPNPEAHTTLLETLTRRDPSISGGAAGGSAGAERLVQMALEIGVGGALVRGAAERYVEDHNLARLLDLLDAVAETSTAALDLWDHLSAPEMLRRLLLEEPVDHAACGRLLQHASAAAAEGLLDALLISESEATRELIFRRLAGLGVGLAPKLVERLEAAPWYLRRNLLALLAGFPDLPPGFSPQRYARDREASVRVEAYRLLFRSSAGREEALRAALEDPDERVVQVAMDGAEVYGAERPTLPRLMKVLNDGSRSPELRARGIRLLRQFESQAIQRWLLQRVLVRRGLFRRRGLAPKTPELVAAVEVFCRLWPQDQKASEILRLAERSGDPQLLHAARPVGGGRP